MIPLAFWLRLSERKGLSQLSIPRRWTMVAILPLLTCANLNATRFLLAGAPYTLQQAQDHLSASAIGKPIKWVMADPVKFLESSSTVYDAAVLAHCIWYFKSPSVLLETFRTLAKRSKRICLAEWSLSASTPSTIPHVLAALTQASMEARKPVSESNIQTVLSPEAITRIARQAGLVLEREIIIPAPIRMDDGLWEVGSVVDPSFVEEIETNIQDQREKAVVHALRDATIAARAKIEKGTKVGAMDIWVATFRLPV